MLNHLQLKTRLQQQLGFSMIELLVVTTIIIVLTTIGLVSYRQVGISARNGRRKTDLETVRQALVLYRADEGSYPAGNDFDDMVTAVNDYLSADAIVDPKNASPYVYTYSSDGITFSLGASLEDDGTAFSLRNP